MARGLHFEGVEMVFILGLPDSPATYLHLAGRASPVQVVALCFHLVLQVEGIAATCVWVRVRQRTVALVRSS